MDTFLDGYKSHIIGLATIGMGLILISQGMQVEGMALILNGMAIMGIRDAITKG